MCRLYGFRANQRTKVECSLVKAQNAYLSRKHGVNEKPPATGWGIACYSNLEDAVCLPELVRHKTAVFDADHFSDTAASTFAKTVLAHVRLATVGYVGTMNSHPFNFRNWSFAHFGTIPEFDKLQDQLEDESGRFQDARLGASDSEQLFLWLLEQLRRGGVDLRCPRADQVGHLLAEAISEIDARVAQVSRQPARLTFILTDGRLMFGCRFHNRLFLLTRNGVHPCEVCGSTHIRRDNAQAYRAALFASTPSTSEPWKEAPEHQVCVIDQDARLSRTTYPIETFCRQKKG